MSQAHAAVMGVFGVLLVAAIIIGLVVVEGAYGDTDPDGEPFRDRSIQLIWTVGAPLAIAYIAAAVGLGQRQAWGKALAYLLMPTTVVLGAVVVGGPVVLWQLVTLTRPE